MHRLSNRWMFRWCNQKKSMAMPSKPKFKPVITRIKLNPEQAVLQCSCYQGFVLTPAGSGTNQLAESEPGCVDGLKVPGDVTSGGTQHWLKTGETAAS